MRDEQLTDGACAAGMDRRAFVAAAAGGLAAFAISPSLAMGRQPASGSGLRVALIGAGAHGRDVLAELGKMGGVSVTGVCEPDSRRLRAASRRARGSEQYGSVADLLKAGNTFDAAIIATPTHTHREVAEQVLGAGKHAYIETPLAHTQEDCQAIVAAARSAGTVVASGLQGRANPVYQLARGFFRSDAVRDLVSMRAQRHKKTSWRVPGGSAERDKELNWKLDPAVSLGLAGEWGTQQFDVFAWYTEQYPKAVRGWGSVRLHKDGREVADTVQCALEWEGGAMGLYDASLANSYEGMYEVLYGTNAAIKLAWTHGWMFKEADAPTQGWEVYANRQQFHNDEGITLIAGATQLAEQGKLKQGVGLPYTGLYYGLADWLAAVSEGGSPSASVLDGARATAIGIAANEAVRTGERVWVDLEGL